MNPQDRIHLLSELTFLRERLAELPDSAKIMRISTESRIRGIENRLAEEHVNEREPERVQLTFNGRPVIGSHGIFAEFGMKAVSNFAEAVTAVAASLCTPLAAMGPIPNREQHQLLITNTALGSFGFELEEYRNGQLPFDEVSPMAQALERTQNLLRGTVGSDDELADSVADTDPRALEKVRTFLQTLADNEAICTVQYRDRGFRFSDVGQIRNSLARLGQDNLRENEQYLNGEFQGVLPKGRTFEFKLTENDEVIRGKIGPAILSADELNAHLHQPAKIKVMMTQIGGGKPRYVLTGMPEWTEGN
jgi:hypothetical protein